MRWSAAAASAKGPGSVREFSPPTSEAIQSVFCHDVAQGALDGLAALDGCAG
jgi:hypothetical protein